MLYRTERELKILLVCKLRVPIAERIGHSFSHSFTCFTNAVSHDFHTVRRINFKVFGLVLLFIIHLRFSRSQYIADVIRKRYGDKTLKNVRKFERLDYQVRKCQLDIEFLNTCHKYNVIPNFLRFCVTNKALKDSLT